MISVLYKNAIVLKTVAGTGITNGMERFLLAWWKSRGRSTGAHTTWSRHKNSQYLYRLHRQSTSLGNPYSGCKVQSNNIYALNMEESQIGFYNQLKKIMLQKISTDNYVLLGGDFN